MYAEKRPFLSREPKNIDNGRQLLWRRLGVIAALLGIVVGGPILLSQDQLMMIGALPFAIAGLLILLRWPPLGLLILLVAAFFGDVNVPALGVTAALMLALMGLWLFEMLAVNRAILLINSATFPPLFLFLATSVVAFIFGQLPWYPITPAPLDGQIGGLGIFVVSAGIFLVTAHQIKDERWLQWLVFLFIALGAVYMLSRIARQNGNFIRRYYVSQAAGSLLYLWLVAMAGSQALLNQKLKPIVRAMLAGTAVATLYVGLILGQGWVSGWAPALVVIIVMLWIAAPKIALPATIIGSLLMLLNVDMIYSLIYVGDNEYSQLTRLAAWRIVGEIVQVNPLLGLGPANYRFYTPLFPILGWYVEFNSHNNYIDIIAQVGLIGLGFFLWFAAEVGRFGWQLNQRIPKGTFAHAYVVGALSGLVGTMAAAMLGDWVLPFAYNVGIEGLRASGLGWIFMGGLIAIGQLYPPPETDE